MPLSVSLPSDVTTSYHLTVWTALLAVLLCLAFVLALRNARSRALHGDSSASVLLILPIYEPLLWMLIATFTVQLLILIIPGPYPTPPLWYVLALYADSASGASSTSNAALSNASIAYFIYWCAFELMAQSFVLILLHKYPSQAAFWSSLRYAAMYAALAASLTTLAYQVQSLGLSANVQRVMDSLFVGGPAVVYALLLLAIPLISKRRSLLPYIAFSLAWRATVVLCVNTGTYPTILSGVIITLRSGFTPIVMYVSLWLDTQYWEKLGDDALAAEPTLMVVDTSDQVVPASKAAVAARAGGKPRSRAASRQSATARTRSRGGTADEVVDAGGVTAMDAGDDVVRQPAFASRSPSPTGADSKAPMTSSAVKRSNRSQPSTRTRSSLAAGKKHTLAVVAVMPAGQVMPFTSPTATTTASRVDVESQGRGMLAFFARMLSGARSAGEVEEVRRQGVTSYGATNSGLAPVPISRSTRNGNASMSSVHDEDTSLLSAVVQVADVQSGGGFVSPARRAETRAAPPGLLTRVMSFFAVGGGAQLSPLAGGGGGPMFVSPASTASRPSTRRSLRAGSRASTRGHQTTSQASRRASQNGALHGTGSDADASDASSGDVGTSDDDGRSGDSRGSEHGAARGHSGRRRTVSGGRAAGGADDDGGSESDPALQGVVDSRRGFEVTGTLDRFAPAAATPASSRDPRKAAKKAAEAVQHVELFHRDNARYIIDWRRVQIGQSLGEGGTSKVHEGRWYVDDRTVQAVAIKLISPKRIDREAIAFWHKENALSAAFHHPNIVSYYGVMVRPPSIGLVFELCDVGSLWDLLNGIFDCRQEYARQRGQDALEALGLVPPSARGATMYMPGFNYPIQLSWKDRLRLARDGAAAIAYLHSFDPPYVHRDIKSQNFLITSRVHMKLSDFGETQTLPAEGMYNPIGTLKWMAPEIFFGERQTESVDMYGFAMVLWELLTYDHPWFEVPDRVFQFRIIERGERPAIPPDTPDAYRALMTACWDDVPTRRPSAATVLRQLNVMYRSAKEGVYV